MSGPYALEAFGDAVFYGQVNIGSTVFTPLLVTSYQKAYGNIYQNLTDIYEPNYAPNMADPLPSPDTARHPVHQRHPAGVGAVQFDATGNRQCHPRWLPGGAQQSAVCRRFRHQQSGDE